MYSLKAPNTIKSETEQACQIDNKLSEVVWTRDTLVVDNHEHNILHTYINGDVRIFTCASPPDKDALVECEFCESPDRNGVYPAERGLHLIKHQVDGSAPCIPCRKERALT
jgi:hypothetical protein